jgi:hypothetical protein
MLAWSHAPLCTNLSTVSGTHAVVIFVCTPLALIGSVLCSRYKCSLSQSVSEIKYHRTVKRRGVTNSLQFIVYVHETANRKLVCRVFSGKPLMHNQY